MNNPVAISALSLQTWCCILSFVFFFVMWMIPFLLFTFLLIFLNHSSKKMANDPAFSWSDLGTTMFFYVVMLFEAHLFLKIWDYYGIPTTYIFDIYNHQVVQNQPNNPTMCLAGNLSILFPCCNNIGGNTSTTILESITAFAQLIVIANKIVFTIGVVFTVFFYSFYKYKQSKTAYVQGGGNFAFLFLQTSLASVVLVGFFAVLFYLFKHLLFFDVGTMITGVLQCLITTN